MFFFLVNIFVESQRKLLKAVHSDKNSTS